MSRLAFLAVLSILVALACGRVPVPRVLDRSTFMYDVPSDHPSVRQVSSAVLSCKSTDPVKLAICKAALRILNNELQAAGIKVDTNGVLFTFNDPTDSQIPNGHSCSSTLHVLNKHIRARFLSTSSINLKGDSLSQPLALRLRLPVAVYAQVDARKYFGFRFFGKCKRVGRDTFYLKADLSTHSDTLIGFAFNPTLGRTASGDFVLKIKPVAAAAFQLENTDLKFRISGIGFLTPIASFIFGFKSTILKTITALFKGDSVKSIFKDLIRGLAWDLGTPIALGIGALPRPIESFIFGLLGNIAERKIEKKAKGFGEDIEDKLNVLVRRALKVDSNGVRCILIRKDFMDLIRRLGEGADIIAKPSPAPKPKCRWATCPGWLCALLRERLC